MTPCTCGQRVRLSATKTRINGRAGIVHKIVHVGDGQCACGGDWTCYAEKPYPKDEAQREYRKLINRWTLHASHDRKVCTSGAGDAARKE